MTKKSDPFRGEGVSGTPRTKRELFVVCPTCQAKIVLWPPPPPAPPPESK